MIATGLQHLLLKIALLGSGAAAVLAHLACAGKELLDFRSTGIEQF